jgi:hypothetical protein
LAGFGKEKGEPVSGKQQATKIEFVIYQPAKTMVYWS